MQSPTGNAPFDAAVLLAEQVRQASMGPVNLQDNTGVPGHVSAPAPALSRAAVLAIDVAYYRSCIAAAIANGISPSPFMMTIRELTGGA